MDDLLNLTLIACAHTAIEHRKAARNELEEEKRASLTASEKRTAIF